MALTTEQQVRAQIVLRCLVMAAEDVAAGDVATPRTDLIGHALQYGGRHRLTRAEVEDVLKMTVSDLFQLHRERYRGKKQ